MDQLRCAKLEQKDMSDIVIDTGTHMLIENISGLSSARLLTYIEALELDVVPDHLIILGSGHVGLEFAQAMHRFGGQVTVIDRRERIVNVPFEFVQVALRSRATGPARSRNALICCSTPESQVNLDM